VTTTPDLTPELARLLEFSGQVFMNICSYGLSKPDAAEEVSDVTLTEWADITQGVHRLGSLFKEYADDPERLRSMLAYECRYLGGQCVRQEQLEATRGKGHSRIDFQAGADAFHALMVKVSQLDKVA
jgi:hypothetical protein